MNKQAQHAIRAARHYKSWGRYATMQYLLSRHVPTRLYYLARMLQAASNIEIQSNIKD